ncbi:MAG TPA: SIMPL domain-containing protein [Candidatus Angelobacter sp.]|jgi:uncharacterized protein YggE|nr:SIMPL domain-containing protein [Candidatus Angelobacter sp.]
MSDATQIPEATRAPRRLLAIGAVVAVAVALGGGVAAGVAAVVSHGAAAPTPSQAGGATLFFPAAQPGQGSSGPATAQGMSAPAMGAGVAGAPAVAYPSTMSQGVAMGSNIAYPYPGQWCSGGSAAPATGPGITATGLAQITVSSNQVSTQTLNVGVQSNDSGQDVSAALNDVEQRLAAIRDALHKAGVADDHISQQGLNVYANGSPKVSNMNVNGGLTATITDPAVLDRAVHAAVAAGASNLNVWSANGASGAQPDDKALQSAIVKATDAAKSTAQAQAQAAGVSLGSLQSSQAQPPSICGWVPGGAQMVVAVTLTYAVK